MREACEEILRRVAVRKRLHYRKTLELEPLHAAHVVVRPDEEHALERPDEPAFAKRIYAWPDVPEPCHAQRLAVCVRHSERHVAARALRAGKPPFER